MKLDDYLSHVRWNELSVASGAANEVPQALMGLLSPDEETQRRSYWQLDNEVVLQSDLYEAAYFVIPVLVQMLVDRVAHGRERIYDLLYEIANGYAPPEIECQTFDGRAIPLKNACVEELKRGLSVFDRDTVDEDTLVKTKAKELVQLLVKDVPIEESNGIMPIDRLK
jgi:hypothetical protein